MTSKHQISRSNENIFADLGFSAEEAEVLRIRADLMLSLRHLIEVHHWSIGQAAQQFKTSESQIGDLINGEIEQFSIERLVSMLTNAGMKVRVEVLPTDT
ncbi:helix-turn-helix domain protein [Leptolyngbya sp. NIES-3755]|nr:helix-turn-helix domain protein [Leptolyngbya sp. NIES-3755]